MNTGLTQTRPKERTAFGTIAIGTRCGKPDLRFLQAWTHACAGGVRHQGDRIIMPQGELPHHWAMEAIANDFLHSDAESLLIIDDDMVFSPADINRLRMNPDNEPFDIVQGLCPSRQPPHAPIVLMDADDGERYRPLQGISLTTGTVECGMVGLGFTLMRRWILEAVRDSLGPNEMMFAWGTDGRGEDCTFCRKAKALGGRIAVDTSVSIGHRFPVEVRYNLGTGEPEYISHQNRSLDRLLDDRNTRGEQ